MGEGASVLRSRLLRNLSMERVLVFSLALSLFLSKVGIYAASALLILYFLYGVLRNPEYRAFFLREKLAISSVALYLLGLAVTIAYPGHLEDLSWYARKATFLLILPPLLYAFQDRLTRRIALIGLLAGFWLAVAYTLYHIGGQWRGDRVPGTWPIDIWSALLALFIAFLVPQAFVKHLGLWRVFYIVTILAAVALLIMGGGRGPWIGALLAVALYLALYQRRALVVLLVLGVLAYLPIQANYAPQLSRVLERVESIADADSYSNWVRLHVWHIALRHSMDTAAHEPMKFLLGRGPLNHERELREFFEGVEFIGAEEKAKLHPHPTNDLHNMYLDSLAKMGLLWTVLVLVFLVLLVIRGDRGGSGDGRHSALGVLLVFLVIGIVYSILPHYLSFSFIFLLVLSLCIDRDASLVHSRLGPEPAGGSGGVVGNTLSARAVAAESGGS
jgi:O-antigen ligase